MAESASIPVLPAPAECVPEARAGARPRPLRTAGLIVLGFLAVAIAGNGVALLVGPWQTPSYAALD